MRTPNLGDMIDEATLLHGSIAQTLLEEFPDAFGVTFFPRSERPKALPCMDVPDGYVDAYSDLAFEARSVELLALVADQMAELQERGRKLLDFTDRFFVKATRRNDDSSDGARVRSQIVGGVSDGTGALCIRRVLLGNGQSFCTAIPIEVQMTAIVEDGGLKPMIESAANDGFAVAAEHLHSSGLLLSSRFKPKSFAATMAWTKHVAELGTTAHLTFEDKVCRVCAYSGHRRTHIFWPEDIGDDAGPLAGKVTTFRPVFVNLGAAAPETPAP